MVFKIYKLLISAEHIMYPAFGLNENSQGNLRVLKCMLLYEVKKLL
jgi:hypothetical protein